MYYLSLTTELKIKTTQNYTHRNKWSHWMSHLKVKSIRIRLAKHYHIVVRLTLFNQHHILDRTHFTLTLKVHNKTFSLFIPFRNLRNQFHNASLRRMIRCVVNLFKRQTTITILTLKRRNFQVYLNYSIIRRTATYRRLVKNSSHHLMNLFFKRIKIKL